MQISFDVAGTPAEFRWNNMNGKTDLRIGDEMIELQAPLAPAALISVSLKRRWHHRAGEHEIEIIKVRPLFLAGFRRNAFTVKVDGVVVAEKKGI